MTKLQTGLTAAVRAAGLAAAGIMPASAAPLSLSKSAIATPQSDVIKVDRRWRKGWYNGYRGYPNYRPGYGYHNGWWFPAGAFVAGALIGGAIANSNYYGGYYGGYYPRYYGGYYPRYYGGYYPRYYNSYYEPRYYRPRYYQPAPDYYPPRSSYRAGYREGYRDGYYAHGYRNGINCTQRLESAGQC